MVGWWVVWFNWRECVIVRIGGVFVLVLRLVLVESWGDRVVRNVYLTAYTCFDPPLGGVS
jgi:hypothetical protein